MQNRSSKRGQGPKDLNQIAFEIVQRATGQVPKEPESEKNPVVIEAPCELSPTLISRRQFQHKNLL